MKESLIIGVCLILLGSLFEAQSVISFFQTLKHRGEKVVTLTLTANPPEQIVQRLTVAVDEIYYGNNSPIGGVLAGLSPPNLFFATGIRFSGIKIPKNVTIINAFLKLTPHEDAPITPPENNYDTVNTRFQGQAADDAEDWPAITPGGGTPAERADYDNRPRTTAYVDWNAIPHWFGDHITPLAGWVRGDDVKSPNLASIIQEIVDRKGWKNGNAIILFWSDNGSVDDLGGAGWPYRRAFAEFVDYMGYSAEPPQVIIEYEHGKVKINGDPIPKGPNRKLETHACVTHGCSRLRVVRRVKWIVPWTV